MDYEDKSEASQKGNRAREGKSLWIYMAMKFASFPLKPACGLPTLLYPNEVINRKS